jgi:Transposase
LPLPALEKGAPTPVTIGVDPHKTSHTAVAVDEHGRVLDKQRIPATLDGYQQLRRWAGRWPQRCWAVEGAHGLGRALAQRLVGDGERVVDVPAKLAARVRVLSVGHGRKSDPDDAVSVAEAARSVPALRRVAVEDQATVLHLVTKRRQELVAARTQAINRLHRLLMDLVPGGASEISPPSGPRRCWPGSRPLEHRRSSAGSWPLSLSTTSASWSSGSPPSRPASRPRSQSPTRPWSGCSAWGRAGRHVPRRGRGHRSVP